jgi:sterol 3beta-glucosyltransferase
MRWPRITLRRNTGTGDSNQSRGSSSSSSETPQGDKVTNPPPVQDPGLARLFSDAASFDRILRPNDVVEQGPNAEDSQAVHDNLNGFTQLVARDLDDHERAASEKLAQLSVSNWGPTGSTTLAPDIGLDESEDSGSEGEQDVLPSGGVTEAAVDPDFVDKLTPEETLDLLQEDFGALAPPGEEKLLLVTDATVFQDVVILVCFILRWPVIFMLTSNAGGGAPHHPSPDIPRVASVV